MALTGIAHKGAVVAIISDANDDVASALAASLEARGIQAQVAASAPESATAIVFLGGLRESIDDGQALAICHDAFAAARAFAPYASEHGGAFITVQDTGGDFGLRGSQRAILGGLAGLAKTADLEWPLASVKAIDLERGERPADQLAAAITDELLQGGPEIEVGLRATGRRTTLRSELSDPGAKELPPMSVLVCSGGARGVTAATLIALARKHDAPPKIALLGRTTLEDDPADCVGIEGEANLKRALMLAAKARGEMIKPAEVGSQVRRVIARREIRHTVDALRAAGSEADYFSTDVSDVTSVGRTLQTVRKQWGPIDAIIHGAGVVADKTIAEKTDEQFNRVISPKVDGLHALLAATQGDPITTLILFSSVAARTGNVGQCDYAIANEILNKMAAREQRRRPECLVKSLNWGPWEAGMVTPALKSYFESHGVPLIPLVTGATMLIDELSSTDPSIEIVLGGEPKRASISGESQERSVLVHIDAKTHPHLADHAIDNTVVLPMVQVIEWFTRAAEAMNPSKLVRSCRSVRVLRGVTLERFHAGGDTLLLKCSAPEDDIVRAYLCDPSDPRKRHYSAELVLADALPAAPTGPAATLPEAPGIDRIYGETLFHGPLFQVIREVDTVSNRGIAGALDTTESIGWRGHWRTDPAALDGGLQLALLWAQHCLGGRSLPTGLGSYERFEIEPRGPLQCTLVGQVDGTTRALSTITFRNPDGRVVAELRDVETHQRP